jgi:hypothetical protein
MRRKKDSDVADKQSLSTRQQSQDKVDHDDSDNDEGHDNDDSDNDESDKDEGHVDDSDDDTETAKDMSAMVNGVSGHSGGGASSSDPNSQLSLPASGAGSGSGSGPRTRSFVSIAAKARASVAALNTGEEQEAKNAKGRNKIDARKPKACEMRQTNNWAPDDEQDPFPPFVAEVVVFPSHHSHYSLLTRLRPSHVKTDRAGDGKFGGAAGLRACRIIRGGIRRRVDFSR